MTSLCEAFFNSGDEIIVVADTAPDPRLRDHPLVVAEPFIRFHAAARLAVNGHTVGTLYAYDMRPRQISTEQVG
ncbi:MAG: GAF domain-containing protein [Caldimonas sp.]